MNKEALKRWHEERGDYTHNLNCNLSEDSIVFDVGGYAGGWAEQIYDKYNCTIYVFEPVKHFYNIIKEKFKNNDKIKVFNIGLGTKSYITDIALCNDGSSIHRDSSDPLISGNLNTESVEIVNISEFMHTHNVLSVDLLKLNIEGEEFPLLEYLIEKNELSKFSNIKIQFHSFMENSVERKQKIREALSESFNLEYDFEFVWEGWKQKEK